VMRMKSKHWNHKKWNGKQTKVDVKQAAKARIGQGGNAIVINASEVGVVRIRP